MFESINYKDKGEWINKLQAVQAELEPFLDDIARKMRENDELKKPRKIAWKPRIYSKIESVLTDLECPMSNSDALTITAEQLYEYYKMYCKLCCWIEEKTGIAYNKDKTEFCYFVAITTTAFDSFQTEGDPYLREAADDIEKRLSNSLNVAMENGDVKSTAGELKQRSKSGIGYKMQTTTANEPALVIPITNNSFPPIKEYTAKLAVIPNQTKQLPKGGK